MRDLTFDKERLEELLELFLQELDKREVAGTVFLVGGAALSLYYFDRETTRDIDAGLPSDPRVLEVIADIAEREGLPENWINNQATMYFGFPPAQYWITKRELGRIRLVVASPELLLAMKLKASRGRRDNEDIVELLQITGLRSLEEVSAIFEEVYAQEAIKPDVLEILSVLLDQK